MTAAARGALVLAAATWLQALRNRLLAVSLLFTVTCIGASLAVASVAVGQRERLIIDIGLAAQSALGAVMTVALAISSIQSDLRRRTAFPVLVRPLPRWAWVLGKYLGIVAAMELVVLVMALACVVTLLVYGGAPSEALWGSIWLTLGEIAVVAALAVLFATLTGPVLAAAFTGGVVLAGNLSVDLLAFAERAAQRGDAGLARLVEAAYWVLPDLQVLSLRSQAANFMDVPPHYVVHGTLYAATYALAVLAVAMAVFSRRKSI